MSNDTSGQICYALVKLENLYAEVREGRMLPQQIEHKLESIEEYIRGIRFRILEETS